MRSWRSAKYASTPPPLVPPEPRSLDVEVRVPGWSRQRRLAFVEEEDRLELRARRAQEAQPALDRLRMRTLVRENAAGCIRLGAERCHDPVAPARNAVGTDVVLLEVPDRRVRISRENPLGQPASVALARSSSVGRRGQMDDVVEITRAQLQDVLVVDHVVRRRRHLRARPCVENGTERADIGHRSSLQASP